MKYLVTAGPGTAKQYCDRIAKARRLVQEAREKGLECRIYRWNARLMQWVLME